MEFIYLFLTIAGFVVGLGAVTVIDINGFLARKNSYWTETTIRVHKVTKPLIWVGIFIVACGIFVAGVNDLISKTDFAFRLIIVFLMVINGSFLSFVISPELLKREKEGRASEVLPAFMQRKITISFLVSVLSWWGMLVYFVSTL